MTVLALPVAAHAQTADGAHAAGVAIELRLESSDGLRDSDFPATLPAVGGAIFLGYAMPRLTIGLGLDLERTNSSWSDGVTDSSYTTTDFIVMPGARISLARAADGRTELLGSADVGYGQMSVSSSPSEGDDPEPVDHWRVQAGPALRYWVSPSFALGATTGIRHDSLGQNTPLGNGTSSSDSRSVTSIYTSLNLTGVF
ncbi:MAG TPA: hypothetical protein VHE35_10135 [Kofleriaceae bacterium]|nr:hypothetical protein [Kofleriaceae bacterium]